MHDEIAPLCPYCGGTSTFRPDSRHIYGRDYGPLYECVDCRAWVGVHAGTRRPLGRLADRKLRAWKRQAHAVFDPLWRRAHAAYPEIKSYRRVDGIARSRAYLWLAEQLQMPASDCHIGGFDTEQCQKVIAIIEQEKPTAFTIRAWAKARSVPGVPP